MNENKDFGFCPRCGALTENGVCRNCSGKQTLQQPKKSNKAVIGLCIGAGVLLIIGFIFAIGFFFHSVAQTGTGIIEQLPEYDFYDEEGEDFYDDAYEAYVPSETDPYYKELADATRIDLEYKVCWASDSITPDDYTETWSYYATYPILEAAENSNKNYDTINALIKSRALAYKDEFRQYEGGADCYGYVTYMDEEKISVVFMHSLYDDAYSTSILDALTFDVRTGTQIYPEIFKEADEDLALRFRSQDKVQNDGVEYVQAISDKELLQILRSDEAFAFYTPVGLEIGFNYEDGWVTVTLKDQSL